MLNGLEFYVHVYCWSVLASLRIKLSGLAVRFVSDFLMCPFAAVWGWPAASLCVCPVLVEGFRLAS